jgi:hypothetical protein
VHIIIYVAARLSLKPLGSILRTMLVQRMVVDFCVVARFYKGRRSAPIDTLHTVIYLHCVCSPDNVL